MSSSPQYKKHEPIGPTAAIVIIVLIFAVGGIYYLATKYMESREPVPEEASEANSF